MILWSLVLTHCQRVTDRQKLVTWPMVVYSDASPTLVASCSLVSVDSEAAVGSGVVGLVLLATARRLA